MTMTKKLLKRTMGLLSTRLPELGFQGLEFSRREVRWKKAALLKMTFLGLVSGTKSLRETEMLSNELSTAFRKKLRIPRRTPDTTLRDFLCAVPVDLVRSCLHRQVRHAQRRKALCREGSFPFHVAAMDGKATSLPQADEEYSQARKNASYGVLRTITSMLVTTKAKPVIDVSPVPVGDNEMSHFKTAFSALCEAHKTLFQVVSYDAGATSRANEALVVKAGKDYFFRLKNEKHTQTQYAQTVLPAKEAASETEDQLSKTTVVKRSVRLHSIPAHHQEFFGHTKTLVSVTSVRMVDDKAVYEETRYWASSLRRDALTSLQWLQMARLHWAVENNGHNTLDTAFAEDAHPWIEASSHGALAVLILRRMAYNFLTLFRSVTQRGAAQRKTPWKELMRRLEYTLLLTTTDVVQSLRPRKISVFI